MTTKELKDLVDKDSTRTKLIENQLAYIKGENPSILKPYPREEPDNRIPIPFARRIVTMLMGYMFKPGSVVYKGDGFDDSLKDLFMLNDEARVTAKIAKAALTHGSAFEVHWLENGKDQFDLIPTIQGIPVYNDALRPFMTEFVRYWRRDDIYYADVYDAITISHFKTDKGSREFKPTGEPILHGYGRVPVTHYRINAEGENVFDHVCPLVDFFDRIVSEDFANELQRFASAYLLMAGKIDEEVDDLGESEIDKIKRTRIFQDLKEKVTEQIAFLTKTVNEGFINSALNNTERLIYEQANTFNPNDDNFGTASGVAQKYKLLAFEYQAAEIATYFELGLQDRVAICKGITATLTGSPIERMYGEPKAATDVVIEWKRNLPDDLMALAQTAVTLQTVLSRETILRLFPTYIVGDVEEELKRVEEEAPNLFEEPVKPVFSGPKINADATAMNGAKVTSAAQRQETIDGRGRERVYG